MLIFRLTCCKLCGPPFVQAPARGEVRKGPERLPASRGQPAASQPPSQAGGCVEVAFALPPPPRGMNSTIFGENGAGPGVETENTSGMIFGKIGFLGNISGGGPAAGSIGGGAGCVGGCGRRGGRVRMCGDVAESGRFLRSQNVAISFDLSYLTLKRCYFI